jgi:hypothetical protein
VVNLVFFSLPCFSPVLDDSASDKAREFFVIIVRATQFYLQISINAYLDELVVRLLLADADRKFYE